MTTIEMKERTVRVGGEWKDEGDGYFSLRGRNPIGFGSGDLAYVAVPLNHPAVGKDYDDLSPDVNGGLTFAENNVFGWDYMHAFNTFDIDGDIANALDYFRSLNITTNTTTPGEST